MSAIKTDIYNLQLCHPVLEEIGRDTRKRVSLTSDLVKSYVLFPFLCVCAFKGYREKALNIFYMFKMSHYSSTSILGNNSLPKKKKKTVREMICSKTEPNFPIRNNENKIIINHHLPRYSLYLPVSNNTLYSTIH